MTGLDIEAIRGRSHLAERLPSGLREHAGRNVAALSDSAADVPLLLAEVERLRAELGEVQELAGAYAGARDEARADWRREAFEVVRLRGQLAEANARIERYEELP